MQLLINKSETKIRFTFCSNEKGKNASFAIGAVTSVLKRCTAVTVAREANGILR